MTVMSPGIEKRLRQAGAETDVALARAAAELFGLDNSGDDDRD